MLRGGSGVLLRRPDIMIMYVVKNSKQCIVFVDRRGARVRSCTLYDVMPCCGMDINLLGMS